MKKILNFSLLAACVSFTSCSKHFIKGEGSVITDTRTIPDIDAIFADGEVDVQVYAAAENRVEVTGYQNLVPIYETRVNNGRLTLEFQDEYINVRKNNIRVKVYTTGVGRVNMNGSGDIRVNDNVMSDKMEAEINGSGDISFGVNHYNELRLKVNGSGDLNAKAAVSEDVFAEISGSGDIDVTANRYLKAKISGSGTIEYWGNPVNGVDTDVSGSGEVKRK